MQISDGSSIARLMSCRVPQAQNAPPPKPNIGVTYEPAPPMPPSAPNPGPNAVPQASEPPPPYVQQGPMAQLMADWGKSNSPYDLDGDGTVGIKDMLQLLKKMAEQPDPTQTDPLQALLDDWGKTDSPHDLNGDGTVGIEDMLQLLAGMTEEPVATPDTLYDPRQPQADDGAGEVQSQSDRLQALLDDWGKSDSIHDLDGDGTVGIQDMLMLLKQMGDEVMQPPAGDTGSDTPGDVTPQTRLEQLLDAWGSADPNFDLDGDGTVGIRDMLKLLAKMANQQPETEHAAGFNPIDHAKFNRIRNYAANYHRVSAHNIARSMLPELASMDPADVRESIQSSNIPDEQKQFVLDQIAAWHPRGHHFSAVG